MPRSLRVCIFAAIVLIGAALFLAHPSGAAVSAWRLGAEPSAEHAFSLVWKFFGSLLNKNGCRIDPDGACLENGCMIDPSGVQRCATPTSAATEANGCMIDPNGLCHQ